MHLKYLNIICLIISSFILCMMVSKFAKMFVKMQRKYQFKIRNLYLNTPGGVARSKVACPFMTPSENKSIKHDQKF